MNRRTLIYAGIPVFVIAGAATWHRLGRNRELDRQAAVKQEGAIAVTTVAVEERSFRASLPFTGTLLARAGSILARKGLEGGCRHSAACGILPAIESPGGCR